MSETKNTEFIKTIAIKNFQAIDAEDGIELEFAIPGPSSDKCGLNVLVGENNSGKSSVIKALHHCSRSTTYGDKFSINSKTLNNPNGIPGINLQTASNNIMEITRPNDLEEALYTITTTREGIQIRFADMLYGTPDIPLGITSQSDDAKVSSNPHRQNMPSVINNIYTPIAAIIADSTIKKGKDSKEIKSLQNFLHYFFDEEYQFKAKDSREIYCNSIPLALAGEGMQRIIMLWDILENSDVSTIVIDEIQTALHPQLQKKLLTKLLDVSREKQIIISTHSENFIDMDAIRKNSVVLYKFTNENNKIIQPSRIDAEYLEKLKLPKGDYQKPYLFDTVAKQIFFSKRILFLEGQEDVGIIRAYYKGAGIDIKFDIFGYGTGGAAAMEKFMKLALRLNIECIGLLDSGKNELEIKKSIEENLADEITANKCAIVMLKAEDIRDKFLDIKRLKAQLELYDEKTSDDSKAVKEVICLLESEKQSKSNLLKIGACNSQGNIKYGNEDTNGYGKDLLGKLLMIRQWFENPDERGEIDFSRDITDGNLKSMVKRESIDYEKYFPALE